MQLYEIVEHAVTDPRKRWDTVTPEAVRTVRRRIVRDLVDGEQRSYAEAARILGISKSYVEKLMGES